MGGLIAVPLILVLAGLVMALVVWASRRQGGALGLRPGILLPPHARAMLLRLFAAVWWIVIISVLIPTARDLALVWDRQPLGVATLSVETLKALLPLIIYVGLTVIRWIITGRWRFGPRW
jgi:hypothetical protein